MLSTMTTSENFRLSSQSGFPLSPCKEVIQPSHVATMLRQNSQIGSESILNCRIIQDVADINNRKIAPAVCYFPPDLRKEQISFFEDLKEMNEEVDGQESDFLDMEVSKAELEHEFTDLLEHLELDESVYEQSKPLKIDPNVLKLDFSKFLINGVNETICLTDFSKSKGASHHLSGGGLLTDASHEDFMNLNSSPKARFCKFSGGGLVMTENVSNFEDCSDLEFGSGVSNFLNQISPSSPLTFDLTVQNESEKNVTSETSFDVENTNPFKNFMRIAREDENYFSPTNPFSDFCSAPSLSEIPSKTCKPPKYENISLPQKSFSQCSTRPASPVLKVPEESCISNPFLINKASPEPYPSAVCEFLLNEEKSQNSVKPAVPNPSSFLFAVPVFPSFQHDIINSSTQTEDVTENSKVTEPVYQNITNQLRKFMRKNDHSEYDLQCLKTTIKDLRTSGWYYENVSWQESVILLKNTEAGTFLIRDSSDPNFLFSLSVQTSRGPTSVRLHYINGQFRLDAEKKLIPHMPLFNSVIELIDYYIENTVKNKPNVKTNKSAKKPGKHGKLQKSKDQVWIDSEGNIYSNILLVKPLYKKEYFASLQHLARLTINRHIKNRLNAKVKFNFRVTPVYESSPFQESSFQNNFDNFCPVLSINALPLPSKLLEFVKEYPYCH